MVCCTLKPQLGLALTLLGKVTLHKGRFSLGGIFRAEKHFQLENFRTEF